MRGKIENQVVMLSSLTSDQLVPQDHPIRKIKPIIDHALGELFPILNEICGDRPPIHPSGTLTQSLSLNRFVLYSK
jgi:hypothetical protein